jgi:hypothetical protein
MGGLESYLAGNPNSSLGVSALTYPSTPKHTSIIARDWSKPSLVSFINVSFQWYAAMNIIVAHCLRHETEISAMFDNKYHYDHYVYNAMNLIPTMMLSPVDEVSVGALLSIVGDFLFVCLSSLFHRFCTSCSALRTSQQQPY